MWYRCQTLSYTVLKFPSDIYCGNGNHWFATVLYYQFVTNKMFEFVINSLSTDSTVPVVKEVFMQYIKDVLPTKKEMTWHTSIIPCAQQPNGYDCGIMTIGKSFTLVLKFLYIIILH